jgi:exopolysaccharide biosynthesis protein
MGHHATEPPELTPEPTPIHYYIPEGSLPAPPREACYGSASIEEAASVMDVIARARDYGLLGKDEETAFDPNANFYYRSDIQYYLDETILTICWKEIVDGNVCSFSEVKIADASQFCRKLSGDAFGSPNQYFASELALASNAVVAMNADYYLFRDLGIVVYDRTLYRFKTAKLNSRYKKYNCIDNLFINGDGDFIFFDAGTEIEQADLERYLIDNDVRFSLAFGPVLVRGGVPQECLWYTVGEVNGSYSRAGIGQMGKLHYLYMCVNHASGMMEIWPVSVFAVHFAEKGVRDAYCLDGGQTAEIVFRGVPYNRVDHGAERLVSDIIFFASALPGEVSP